LIDESSKGFAVGAPGLPGTEIKLTTKS